MHHQDAALIPPNSPLTFGWRADLVAILVARNLVDVMDTIAQFAEMCVRRDPDTARDPLDAAESAVFCRAEVKGRTKLNDDAPLTMTRAADPAHRRIDRIAELESALNNGRSPNSFVLRGAGSKLRTSRSIERRKVGRPALVE